MSFAPNIPTELSKPEKYKRLLADARSLIDLNADTIANMANLSRLIFDYFPHHWIGFYRVINDKLILGPYQGPIACTTIEFGRGVCGTAWQQAKTQVIENVHEFPGHIACSALSNSEIVIPCLENGEVYAVLDIDSINFSEFDTDDAYYLEQLVTLLSPGIA